MTGGPTATQWLKLPVINIEFTNVDPNLSSLLAGPEKPATGHTVQVDYRIQMKLRWWRWVWLRARHKPLSTYPAQLLIPNATVTATDPGTAGQP